MKPIVRNLVLVLRLLLYCNMYSVRCVCHNPVCFWNDCRFCIFEYSMEASVYNLKLFKNRFRKDNCVFKKCRLSKLLLKLVVKLSNEEGIM